MAIAGQSARSGLGGLGKRVDNALSWALLAGSANSLTGQWIPRDHAFYIWKFHAADDRQLRQLYLQPGAVSG